MVNLDDARSRHCADPMTSASDDVHRTKKGTPAVRSATLVHLIEVDIIPRLLIANGWQAESAPTAALDVEADDIYDFAQMMISLDLARAHLVIAGAREQGVSMENIMLKLFAPTANRLGVMWEDDDCTFTDVTVGLCALQSLVRSLSSGDIAAEQVRHDGRVMIAAAPHEQHTFGVLMLETFFRRAGWDVVGMPLSSRDEVLAAVSRREFSIVGFSAAREDMLPDLKLLISAVRSASLNSDVSVMVGGRAFLGQPSRVKQVGADLTAATADEALVASQHLLCSRVQTH